MATPTAPAASSATKPNNRGGLTPVTVTPPRKVTYIFKATAKSNRSNLRIPYVVAVDGAVLPAFSSRAGRVSGKSGQVVVTVLQGQRVNLHLNSDAAADWREHPVYAVIPGERDVVVTITEKEGKHTDTDTPIKQVDADSKVEAAKATDTYAAPLTGDIWMKVSHKYTAAEVDNRVPAGTSEAVKAAVKSIYSGLSRASLTVAEPAAGDKPARNLTVTFEDSGNPRNNISSYSLLADGLPRAHPAGYASLINAALENSITSVKLSSCWRPLLGSIAHRAGLGLDVSALGGTVLNREELREAFEGKNPSKRGDGDDGDNVTDAEVLAFGEYEASITANKAAAAELEAATRALPALKKKGDAETIKAAEERMAAATQAAGDAAVVQREAQRTWNTARDAGEPNHVRGYRASLLKCVCVRQLFDPWMMDTDTQDKAEPDANRQTNSNEQLHAHHLHITVDDPKIL